MKEALNQLFEFIHNHDGINNKSLLSNLTVSHFSLIKDGAVYYNSFFAIRFCTARTNSFSNTVLSLSRLIKYDHMPFIVCIVAPLSNVFLIANSTFLTKISHSSQTLSTSNIRGSFNGSDIIKSFEGIENTDINIEFLYNIHKERDFTDTLALLVERTNGIVGSGRRFEVNHSNAKYILSSPERAINFMQSHNYSELKSELDKKVETFSDLIMTASFIEDGNTRGRLIEYLIAGKDESLRQHLVDALTSKNVGVPKFKTDNSLGDYQRDFERFDSLTDVKTKIMLLNSNPKAYNVDKILEFLSTDRSVFMLYFIGIEPGKILNTILVSMFQQDLLDSTVHTKHWSGRNSRGATQFHGEVIKSLLHSPKLDIDQKQSTDFLQRLIEL